MPEDIDTPVRRRSAEHYLFLLLLSFATSVVLTRWYLALTGYPQIGNGTLHIAHVLWGGLLLFIAILLVLIWANSWVYRVGAVLGGAGVGLFIDEVGKFITRANDYFYPLAAPLIYSLFLATVWIYLRVRRPLRQDARARLYGVFDALGGVLDHDLDTRERDALVVQLRDIQEQTERPDLARLAAHLRQFLETEAVVVPRRRAFWERWALRLRLWLDRIIPARLLRALLVLGLAAVSLLATVQTVSLLLAAGAPAVLRDLAPQMAATVGDVTGVWFLVRLVLVGATAIGLLVATGSLLAGRDVAGFEWGCRALIFGLTLVNLVAFYFDQFTTVGSLLVQLAVLLGARYYQRRYLSRHLPLPTRSQRQGLPAQPA